MLLCYLVKQTFDNDTNCTEIKLNKILAWERHSVLCTVSQKTIRDTFINNSDNSLDQDPQHRIVV